MKDPGGNGGYPKLDPPAGWGISLDPGRGLGELDCHSPVGWSKLAEPPISWSELEYPPVGWNVLCDPPSGEYSIISGGEGNFKLDPPIGR